MFAFSALYYHYHHHRQRSITRIDRIKNLGIFMGSKLHFHNRINYKFSQCIKLLDLVRSVTFSLTSLGHLYVESFF
jgi:hypothetical protein